LALQEMVDLVQLAQLARQEALALKERLEQELLERLD
jgi:hypothetical protein